MVVREMTQVYERLGLSPYNHQKKVWQVLKDEKPIVLRAPTGSGKTESVFLPFVSLRGNSLPLRLLYALPLRSLANQVAERMEEQAKKLGKTHLRVRLQHGEAPESVLFAADTVVCTIDQLVTSYACTPLTLPLRHGNIPAGAVMSSFIVFDEVHLFDPDRALQAMRLICERLHKLGLPFVLLSATLPDCVLNFWREKFGCELIDVPCDTVERSVQMEFAESELDEEIIKAMQSGHQRILVVVNTVERAIALFKEVCCKAREFRYECELLHSRFLPEDRKNKESWLVNRFSKNTSDRRSLFIATQVVEAGLDISADCVLTELAPIDAIIQRAGRCARWGGEGVVKVFDVKKPAPYDGELVDKTREVLKLSLPTKLSWQKVKCWVNKVLGDRYARALEETTYERTISHLSYAAFTGDRSEAEKAVRDLDTVEVTLHEQPESLCEDALRLPTISVHTGIVRSWLKEGAKAWRVEVDRNPTDWGLQAKCVPVRSDREIAAGDRIVLSPQLIVYDCKLGLRRGEGGKGFKPSQPKEKTFPKGILRKETWIDHTVKVVCEIEKLLEQDKLAVKGLASLLDIHENEVKRAAKLAAMFHDLGKLTVEWQQQAGVSENACAEELLAHTSQRDYTRFPPHATVSAYALWDALRGFVPCHLSKAILLAIAHHHSVRAHRVPAYKLHKNWHKALERAAKETGLDNFPIDKVFREQQSTVELRDKFPPIEHERLYTAYVLLSKWLRVADRIATEGSEDAIFRYEDWFGRL